MRPTIATNWRSDFGIADRGPPYFFESKDQLGHSTPQAFAIRRAFDLLELDAVFCSDEAPLIYFKQTHSIVPEEVFYLHKRLWNLGGAPVLVLISPDEIHVYSGMIPPAGSFNRQSQPPSLVEKINRISDNLREFLTSIESGTYFERHARSFDPEQRVDRSLLRNLTDTRNALIEISATTLDISVLDALLCRLVFTCYLFDRGVILPKYLEALGIRNLGHLRDVLSLIPSSDAKAALYKLFIQLQKDFNGDLFHDDLNIEAGQITTRHIQTLAEFFRGTLVRKGQRVFWPYDFSAIPIETISAIYERFLKAQDRQSGAFYTPRVLAELVLDTALEHLDSLLTKRMLDPACGSGVFLVGLFNRMAEEWRQRNPNATNMQRARELMRLLRENLYGVDINLEACRITAFSLYLAYLDQLSPRDIQELQTKGGALPRLIGRAEVQTEMPCNIRCMDFFDKEVEWSTVFDLIVGNPPWGSLAGKDTPAGIWCVNHKKSIPDKQIAAAFIWKAIENLASKGKPEHHRHSAGY